MSKSDIIELNEREFEMRCFKFGEGNRNFVILPGLSLKSIIDSAGIVRYDYKDFTKDFTVYVFDIKEGIKDGVTIDDLADDTAHALKLLDIKSACFFGASMGGMMVQSLMVNHPALVERAVLGSTCAKAEPPLTDAVNKWRKLALDHDVVGLNRSTFELLFTDEFLWNHGAALKMLESIGTDEECERLSKLAGACGGFDIIDKLNNVKCPALVIAAALDKVIPPQLSQKLAEALGAEFYVYENYAHAAYDEAPDYKNRILEFFNKSF